MPGHFEGAGVSSHPRVQQAILVTRFATKKDPHMYPYSAKMTGRLAKLLKVLHGRGKRD